MLRRPSPAQHTLPMLPNKFPMKSDYTLQLPRATRLALALAVSLMLGTSGLSHADTEASDAVRSASSPATAESPGTTAGSDVQVSERGGDAASASEQAPLAESATIKQAPAPVVRQVTLVAPHNEVWPDQIEANGNVMPWQETRVGPEIGGLRLVSVLANVGDVVKKGDVLARLNTDLVQIELATANAQLMEAQAALREATETLDRAQRLVKSGGVSQQDLMQYQTKAQTAEARIQGAQAQVRTQELRLDHATLLSPDDGVISSRTAAEGAIVQAGSELFRLIRQARLEWRAEVSGETLLRVSVGQRVTVKSPLGDDIVGRVRQIAPTVNLTTRNGLVYVDLPAEANLKAGLQVSGVLDAGKRKALVLPASSLARDAKGQHVFRVNSSNQIEIVEVKTGRTQGDWVEIVDGLDRDAQVIAEDVGSLQPGEAVVVKARG